MARTSRAFSLRLLAAALALAPVAALAQAAVEGDVAIERMRLSSTRDGVLGVEGSTVPAHLEWEAGGWLGFAKDPLVLVRESDGERAGSLVGNRLGGAVGAAIGLWDRYQLAVELPYVLFQDSERGSLAPGALPSLSTAALGALAVVPKVRLLDASRHGVGLAGLVSFRLPTGTGDAFAGSSGVEVAPEIAAGRELDRLRLRASVGATLRGTDAVLDLRPASELLVQVGAALRTGGAGAMPAEWLASLTATAAARRPFAREAETGLEARGAAAWELRGLRLLAGAGLAVTEGWGFPSWRLFVASQWAPRPARAAAQPPAPEPPLAAAPPAEAAAAEQPAPAAPAEPEPAAPPAPEPVQPEPPVLAAAPAPAPEPPPAPDRDGDGASDDVDRCPDLAGPAAEGGCPASGAVKLAADRIEIEGAVHFDSDRDVIQPRSFELLEGVARVIAAHAEVGVVRVEGHTDASGGRARNVELSRRRARAVVRWLSEHGVPAERLESEGYGPDRPIAENATPEGRARNRRVEFRLAAPRPPAG
jgi:outer membrane protein OmpA-like peptidoglycan-associated protein